MPSFKLVKSESRPLTRELAEAFRDMPPSPTERDLNPQRIKHLREKAEQGQLVTFNWARARLGAKVLRMNGQHSSSVLCGMSLGFPESGGFPEGLVAHIDDYEVDGPEGLALLFRQFDDRKSGRSAGDVAGAYQSLHANLRGVSKPVGKLGIDGVAWYLRTVEAAPTGSGDDVYELFNKPLYHPFLLWLGEVLGAKSPEMKRVQVVASMYATHVRNEIEAGKFWTLVASGGDFEEQHPTRVLAQWLQQAKDGTLKDDPKPAQLYQGCIYAWNRYRDEKIVKEIRFDTRKGMYELVE